MACDFARTVKKIVMRYWAGSGTEKEPKPKPVAQRIKTRPKKPKTKRESWILPNNTINKCYLVHCCTAVTAINNCYQYRVYAQSSGTAATGVTAVRSTSETCFLFSVRPPIETGAGAILIHPAIQPGVLLVFSLSK